ncbi:hypothetical protein [Parasphingorhabdus pacifica]
MGAFADATDPLSDLSKDDTNQASGDDLKAAIEDANWRVQAVNWVYEQVTGQNLVETLIAPITGDFAKIEQNAEAWGKVGGALAGIRENLNTGISELRETWDGDGANALETLLVGTWTVALEADARVADLISSGFQKAADTSRQMCDKALELVEKLVNRLIETALTGWIPVAGWANVVRQVIKCIDIVMAVLAIFEALQQMYQGVMQLIESIKSTGTSLMKIKDVRSLGDAVELGYEVTENASGAVDAAGQVSDGFNQARGGVSDVRSTASSFGDNGSGGGGSGGDSTGAGASGDAGSGGSGAADSGSGDSGYQTAMSGNL